MVGHRDGDLVLLVRRGAEIFTVAANSPNYGGPLLDGLVAADTVRCPWHHACFDLNTGEALRAPALSPLACWSVEHRDARIFVGEKRQKLSPTRGKASQGSLQSGSSSSEVARSARAISERHRHDQRRRGTARRPPQPFKGLSLGQGA
ncbi:Rieske 2Fe-2S domain-containing protein [Rhizobium grahamii]|uniref:Rieske 2Fe-2S domain-containing protein n=1 Tax=Rhizobium grahamii TaxID=1120045 RepID=UPI003137D603